MSFCKDIYELLCQKHPDCSIYIIADHHFYHQNILNYTRKEFNNLEEMNEFILKKHNETINHEDIVIFLGDFCFKTNHILDLLTKMNGHKYLVLGNHDSKDLIRKYPSLGFEGIFTMPIKIKDNYLSHEPLLNEERNDLTFQLITKEFKTKNALNYHGHIHDTIINKPNYHNVTCENLNYKPIFLEKTNSLSKQTDLPLFINSPYFTKSLDYLTTKHHLNPQILIQDYIYSTILGLCSNSQNNFFIQGSFGLAQKYDYFTKFSDLDLTYLYNPNLSKDKNIESLKKLVDYLYCTLNQQIINTNMQYLKRYTSLRIFELLYTNSHNYFTKCYLDANLIFLDCYQETDFVTLNGKPLLTKYLNPNYLLEFQFPTFNSQFLKPEGDIINLILQYFFQQNHPELKPLILKKLQLILKQNHQDINIKEFSNLLARLFLRNIAFLKTVNRNQEIVYILNQRGELSNLINTLPSNLAAFISPLILNKNSLFSTIYDEICTNKFDHIFETSQKLIKELKQ